MSSPVITRGTDSSQNIRTAFEKLLARAGVKQWPKLFQNMRASRETELLAEFPAKDVCDWLGNSQAVAMKHYAMATAESFRRAVCGSTGGSISAAQEQSGETTEVAKPMKNKGLMTPDGMGISPELAEAGLERVINSPANTRVVRAGGAECGAVFEDGKLDERLQLVIDAWPKLPDIDRERLFSLISDRLKEDR